MHLSYLLSGLSASAVLASPAVANMDKRGLDERASSSCDTVLIKAIEAKQAQPKSWCTQWLATRPHTVSPHAGYLPRQVSAACECIIAPVSSTSSKASTSSQKTTSKAATSTSAKTTVKTTAVSSAKTSGIATSASGTSSIVRSTTEAASSTLSSADDAAGQSSSSAVESVMRAIETASFIQVLPGTDAISSTTTTANSALQTSNGSNKELLTNGGLDSGDIPPWSAGITANMGLEVVDGAGTNGQALFAHFFTQGSRRAQMLLSQAVSIFVGDTLHYISTFTFNYGYGLPEGVSCDAAWFVNDQYYQLTRFNSSTGATYQFVYDALVAASAQTSANIYLACSSTGKSVDFPISIDDVSLVANWDDPRPAVWTDTTRFVQFFRGTGVTQNTLTTGNPAAKSSTLRVADESAAIQACAEKTTYEGQNKAFDVHYSSTSARWVCTQFPQAWQSPSQFNVVDPTVTTSLGYFLHFEDPTKW